MYTVGRNTGNRAPSLGYTAASAATVYDAGETTRGNAPEIAHRATGLSGGLLALEQASGLPHRPCGPMAYGSPIDPGVGRPRGLVTERVLIGNRGSYDAGNNAGSPRRYSRSAHLRIKLGPVA